MTGLMPPRAGDTGRFYCIACKQWFTGTLKSKGILAALFLKSGYQCPRCPVCRSKHTIHIAPNGVYH